MPVSKAEDKPQAALTLNLYKNKSPDPLPVKGTADMVLPGGDKSEFSFTLSSFPLQFLADLPFQTGPDSEGVTSGLLGSRQSPLSVLHTVPYFL